MNRELKIIALAPRDGWAFIEEDGHFFLLSPPYTVSSKVPSTPQETEEAVMKHGFHSVSYSFDNYADLVKYIKNEYVKADKKSGKPAPTLEELKELLDYAPEDVLIEFLDRAEKELIPEGKIEAAESMALDFLKLEKVKENEKLFDHALNIIYKCADSRKKRKSWEMTFKKRRLKSLFGSIGEKYPLEQVMEAIEATHNRGLVFSLPY